MTPFNLSAVDIVIAIAVSVLLILYITSNSHTEKETSYKKPKIVPSAEAFTRARTILSHLLPYSFNFFLITFGLIIMAWVGWSIWYDVTWWSKDIVLIFFGSRTGEAVSLGIGMKIFDYFLIGLILPLSGLVISSRRRAHGTICAFAKTNEKFQKHALTQLIAIISVRSKKVYNFWRVNYMRCRRWLK